jgi:glyoxylase-like metal-dependent hydrolase (beta-lactamase superfamily II)
MIPCPLGWFKPEVLVSEVIDEMSAERVQSTAVYRKRVGSTIVTALSDGYFGSVFDLFRGLDPAEGEALLRSAHQPCPPRIQVNAFLVEQRGTRILVDTGCGGQLGPTVNKLQGNLAAAGVNNTSIDAILCTHIHPDHTNGLVDVFGEAVFPNAEVYVHSADAAFWLSEENRDRAPAEMKVQFDWARAAFSPYRERTHLIAAGEVLPGVDAIGLPGHTPGHCGYTVHSDGEALLIWGDAVHSISLQTARPEVTFAADVDADAARDTRLRLFDQVATDRLLFTGMHLEFPGFGYLTRYGDAFRYEPDGRC